MVHQRKINFTTLSYWSEATEWFGSRRKGEGKDKDKTALTLRHTAPAMWTVPGQR